MASPVASVTLLCIENRLLWSALPRIKLEGSCLFEDNKVNAFTNRAYAFPCCCSKGKKRKNSMYLHSQVVPHLCVSFSVCFRVYIYIVAMALFCISILLSCGRLPSYFLSTLIYSFLLCLQHIGHYMKGGEGRSSFDGKYVLV